MSAQRRSKSTSAKVSLDFQGKPIPKSRSLTIQAELVDANGSVLTSINDKVAFHPTDQRDFTAELDVRKGQISIQTNNDPASTGRVIGATADLTRGKTPDGIQIMPSVEDVLDTFQQPTAIILNGHTLAASRRSPYRMQILVKGKPIPMRLEDGQPFVDLKQDDVFMIRYINLADHKTAAKVMLDGVSVFAFSELRHRSGPKRGEPTYERYVFRPKTTVRPERLVHQFAESR